MNTQQTTLEITGTPWTPGPWHVGPSPTGNCRIYSKSETHAIARTYGPDLNGIPTCELTGPNNAADAALIALAPEMANVCIKLKAAYLLDTTIEESPTMMQLVAQAMGEAVELMERLAAATQQ